MKKTDGETIRRIAIQAVASAGIKTGSLVLKGGNALAVVYGIGGRTSLDLDYSLEGDFPDVKLAENRVVESLQNEFLNAGYKVFDVRFYSRPPIPREEWLGGYEVLFKLIPVEESGFDLDRLRRSATVVGPFQERVFRIQISRYEFVGDPIIQVLGGTPIPVYSPALIAAEKLRAICQQLPDYSYAKHPHPRARDFYDIRVICMEASVDLTSAANTRLLRKTFAAKRVSWSLLGRIESTREFHRVDWPAVEGSVSSLEGDFDFYFEFVVELAKRLEAARDE